MDGWFGGGKGVYERCGWCEAPIRYGEESVTVTLNTEKAEEEAVEVLRSDVLLVLCLPCGGGLDEGSLRRDLDDRRPAL